MIKTIIFMTYICKVNDDVSIPGSTIELLYKSKGQSVFTIYKHTNKETAIDEKNIDIDNIKLVNMTPKYLVDLFKNTKNLFKPTQLTNVTIRYNPVCKDIEFDRDEPESHEYLDNININVHDEYLKLVEYKYELLTIKYDKLKQKYRTIVEENNHLRYKPGGEGYNDAKQHFESLCN